MNASRPPIVPDKPWLAPLAGWSDLPFRLLCREHGAAVCCTEMVSAKGLVYDSNGTRYLIDTDDADSPLVIQIFGAEKEFIARAAAMMAARGFTYFDLNMGCSVRKVSKTCSGAAMLRDPDNALAVAEALIAAVGPGRCGFKLRLGWDDTGTWRYLAPRLEQLGAGWITLHPRTAMQHFSGSADWTALGELKTLVSIPVIASGDLFSAADGVRCLRETGVDAVMYARGALSNPAIFEEHARLLAGGEVKPPDTVTLQRRIRRTAELARTYADHVTAFLKMRTIAPGYIRSRDGAKRLRMAIVACRNWEEFDAVIDSMPDILGPDTG